MRKGLFQRPEKLPDLKSHKKNYFLNSNLRKSKKAHYYFSCQGCKCINLTIVGTKFEKKFNIVLLNHLLFYTF